MNEGAKQANEDMWRKQMLVELKAIKYALQNKELATASNSQSDAIALLKELKSLLKMHMSKDEVEFIKGSLDAVISQQGQHAIWACGTLDCVCNEKGACDCHNFTMPKQHA